MRLCLRTLIAIHIEDIDMASKKTKKKTAKTKPEIAITVVSNDNGEVGLVPTPPLAIAEEATMKVVDQGRTTYYTETEYRKKFGKKEK